MKALRKLALVLVAFLLLVVIAAHFWIDRMIKDTVERVGSKMTQSPVTLDDVDTSFLFGRVRFEGLVVGNPRGFQAPSAFKVHKASVSLDLTTVRSDTFVIHAVAIDGPELTFEGLPGRNNLSVIRDRVQAYTASESTGKPRPAAERKGGAGPRVLIREFTLTNGRVTVLVGGKSVSVALPDLRLRDIGKRSGGATAQEVASAVTAAIYHVAIHAVTNMDQTVQKGAELLGESAKQIGRSAEDAAAQVLEGVTGFFKKKE